MAQSSIFLSEEQIQRHLRYPELIPALKQALIDFSAGHVTQPIRTILPIPQQEAFFCVMPAVYGDVMGAKLVNIFPQNAARGLHTHLALLALFRSQTGELIAVMDAALITEMRTAAVSAIATDLLSPPNARVLAVLGSGVQARAHIQALTLVRHFEEIRIWSRNATHAETLASEVGGMATTAEQAVRGASVVVTATNSPTPILRGGWLAERVHVNAVGAVGPTRRELDSAAVQGFIVVESREAAAKESGDLLLAEVTAHAELGELLAGAPFPKTGRTVYKSLGVAIEDVAAARLICANAGIL